MSNIFDDDEELEEMDPYEAWGMDQPDPEDGIDSDFGNWGND